MFWKELCKKICHVIQKQYRKVTGLTGKKNTQNKNEWKTQRKNIFIIVIIYVKVSKNPVRERWKIEEWEYQSKDTGVNKSRLIIIINNK